MARVSTCLNFQGKTEEAFKFYKSVFKTEFGGNGIHRFGEIPENPATPLSAEEKEQIMHIELPITGGHVLMGTDAPESMGFRITFGNNLYINLEPDTKAETNRLYDELTKNGTVIMPLRDMFWGSYFGTCTDQFGVNWMFNCSQSQK
jgi:PhnB protein